MKREAINHTKMKRLCRRLDLPLWQGVGLLESLWHLAARETPRGDIGKLTDEDIALAIDYRGDENKLIEALVSAGWIDRHDEARLIVHHWSEHADSHVHAWLAKRTLLFADGNAPRLHHDAFDSRTRARIRAEYAAKHGTAPGESTETPKDSGSNPGESAETPEKLPAIPEPIPEPVYITPLPPLAEGDGAGAPLEFVSPGSFEKPRKTASNRTYRDVLEQVAKAIHDRHPNVFERRDLGVGGVEKKLEAILKHKHIPASEAEAYLRRVDKNHAAACQSEAWQRDGGQYVKALRNYLAPTEGRYEIEPATAAKPVRLMA